MTPGTRAQRHAARARLLSWLLKPANDFGAALLWLVQAEQVCAETELACRAWQIGVVDLPLNQREAAEREVRALLGLAQQLRAQWMVRARTWRTATSTANRDAWQTWLDLILSEPLDTPSPERTRHLRALLSAYQRQQP